MIQSLFLPQNIVCISQNGQADAVFIEKKRRNGPIGGYKHNKKAG